MGSPVSSHQKNLSSGDPQAFVRDLDLVKLPPFWSTGNCVILSPGFIKVSNVIETSKAVIFFLDDLSFLITEILLSHLSYLRSI